MKTLLMIATAAGLMAQAVFPPAAGSGSGGTLASQAEAEAGTENTKFLSSLRVAQAISAQTPVPSQTGNGGKVLATDGSTATWKYAAHTLTETSSSNTTYTATDPTLAAYTDGLFKWIVGTSCTTGAKTLNINSLGSKSLKLADGTTNPATTDCTAGMVLILAYDGTLLRIIAGNPATSSGGGDTVDPAVGLKVRYSWVSGGANAGGSAIIVPGTSWTFMSDSTLTTVTATASEPSYMGLVTGAVDTQRARMTWNGQTVLYAGQAGLYMSFEAKLSHTTNDKFWGGFAVDYEGVRSTADCADQCAVFRYIAGTDTNFQCVTRGASGATTRDSGVAADTSKHRFSVAMNSGSPIWKIDGTTVCATNPTTNVPSTVGWNPAVGISTVGANDRTLSLAYIYVEASI